MTLRALAVATATLTVSNLLVTLATNADLRAFLTRCPAAEQPAAAALLNLCLAAQGLGQCVAYLAVPVALAATGAPLAVGRVFRAGAVVAGGIGAAYVVAAAAITPATVYTGPGHDQPYCRLYLAAVLTAAGFQTWLTFLNAVACGLNRPGLAVVANGVMFGGGHGLMWLLTRDEPSVVAVGVSRAFGAGAAAVLMTAVVLGGGRRRTHGLHLRIGRDDLGAVPDLAPMIGFAVSVVALSLPITTYVARAGGADAGGLVAAVSLIAAIHGLLALPGNGFANAAQMVASRAGPVRPGLIGLAALGIGVGAGGVLLLVPVGWVCGPADDPAAVGRVKAVFAAGLVFDGLFITLNLVHRVGRGTGPTAWVCLMAGVATAAIAMAPAGDPWAAGCGFVGFYLAGAVGLWVLLVRRPVVLGSR
ncbi:MAG: hypothetical protein K2X82_20235 [Gemmataceae bacterium]|nr:hypothetical protein [Gemmataceae bacterium]